MTLAKGGREGHNITIILLEFPPDFSLVSAISPLAPLLQAQVAALGKELLQMTSFWLVDPCSLYSCSGAHSLPSLSVLGS